MHGQFPLEQQRPVCDNTDIMYVIAKQTIPQIHCHAKD